MARTNIDIDDEARALRGAGWDGDLDLMRSSSTHTEPQIHE